MFLRGVYLIIVLQWCALAATQTSGFVYVATNDGSANSVVRYSRGNDGLLTPIDEVATGGQGGSGNGVGNLDPLGSQDSLVLSGTGSLLLVVNAGSNSVSSIGVSNTGLQLLSNLPSGGSFPNSLALNGTLVYVLNAHGTPNIAGFRLSASGVLSPIPSSIKPLPGGSSAAPHDIRFSPDGTRLLVTEGGTDQIDIFQLDSTGLTTSVVSQTSSGSGPFGFKFGRDGALVNAEANSASVSSYFLTAENNLKVISSAVPDTQMAACWISLTGDGKFGFVSNTASGTLSAYHVAGNGTLNLESAVAASLSGGAPIDSALSSDSAFFFVVDSALGRVVFFRVNGASLLPLGSVTGLPTTVQGIAVQ
jgi:6-phosphogluconolactonase (cycloisomerase 2 family)